MAQFDSLIIFLLLWSLLLTLILYCDTLLKVTIYNFLGVKKFIKRKLYSSAFYNSFFNSNLSVIISHEIVSGAKTPLTKSKGDRLTSNVNFTQIVRNGGLLTHVMPDVSFRGFLTRSSVISQNNFKMYSGLKGAHLFTGKRFAASLVKKNKTFKTIIFDMFLTYQFSICVKPTIPISHLIPLSLLTCIFGSLKYIILYWISILYILATLYVAEKFPNSFGSKYLSFLKRHSSPEAFEKYCGNPWGALKLAIKHPEFIKIVVQNGAGKALTATGVALTAEHTFHKAKVGQIYEYKVDQHLNSGKHSSGKSFSFKPNGPSMAEKLIGRNVK